jgi:hypothetical protein
MKAGRILLALGTLTLSAQAFSGTARADDPNDRMTPEDIARDAAIIRKLNRDQLEYVRKRDAQYAAGWKAYDRANNRAEAADYGDTRDDESDYQASRRDYADQSRAYAQARRDYETDLAQWRRDVAACRAGDYARCE